MAEDSGFLSRWSKRKLAIQEAEARKAEPLPAEQPTPETALEQAPPDAEEPFDISTLPSIESLTAESDIRDFLRKEVPEALKNAALRRMWTQDEFIRTYIGPADYAWDFNDPTSIPGFGPMDPVTDVAAQIRHSIGTPEPARAVDERHFLDSTPSTPPRALAEAGPEADDPALLDSGEDVAARQDASAADAEAEDQKEEQVQKVARLRRHGGAVPR
jgi:hypothetical protein